MIYPDFARASRKFAQRSSQKAHWKMNGCKKHESIWVWITIYLLSLKPNFFVGKGCLKLPPKWCFFFGDKKSQKVPSKMSPPPQIKEKKKQIHLLGTPPKNWHSAWKWMFERLVYFGARPGLFSGGKLLPSLKLTYHLKIWYPKKKGSSSIHQFFRGYFCFQRGAPL